MTNMNGNKKEKSQFFRILILDDISLNQLKSFRLSRSTMYIYIATIVLAVAVIMSLLFIFTPLNYLFPDRSNVHLKKQIIENSIVIDSLKSRLEQHNNYVAQLKNILQGKIPTDTLKKATVVKHNNSSNGNLEFASSYMDSIIRDQIQSAEIEEFTEAGSGIKADNNLKNLHFIVPLKGIITRGFNSSESHFGIDITPGTDNAVLAILSGTIILTEWSIETGHVIGVQHDNNLISFYKHNARLLKETGDRVTAGESIAIAGNSGENTSGPHLHFELWKNGVPVDPKDYITF